MTGPITPEEVQAFRDAAPKAWTDIAGGPSENQTGHVLRLDIPLSDRVNQFYFGTDGVVNQPEAFIGWSTGWLIEQGHEVHSRTWEGKYYVHLRHAHMSRSQFIGQGPTLAIAHFRCVLAVLLAEKEAARQSAEEGEEWGIKS